MSAAAMLSTMPSKLVTECLMVLAVFDSYYGGTMHLADR